MGWKKRQYCLSSKHCVYVYIKSTFYGFVSTGPCLCYKNRPVIIAVKYVLNELNLHHFAQCNNQSTVSSITLYFAHRLVDLKCAKVQQAFIGH